MTTNSRRDFIKKIGIGTASLSIGGNVFGKNVFGGAGSGFSAKSYRNIIGANDRINIATIGEKTAKAVENYGLTVNVIPDEYRAE